MNKLQIIILALGVSLSVFSQDDYNPILTTSSFLRISPDSRGSALGDAGVATSSDIYSQYWNPAKYAFSEDGFGLGVSYTPWLRQLVNDIDLVDLTGFYRFDETQTISGSFRYFSMGEIIGTDVDGSNTGQTIAPHELAFDVAYARKFSPRWSGSVAFRYIRSDIYGDVVEGLNAGNAFSVDMSSYYRNEDMFIGDYKTVFAFGVNASNIGSKLSYNSGVDQHFLPANLGIGTSLKVDIDNYNTIMGTIDINKLLVPSSSLNDSIQDDLDDMGSLEGVFKSFNDAPGGFKEELNEIMVSLGLEYTYDETFSLRGGYFYEHETKGNRKFFSFGAGFKMNVFALDVSYLVPTVANSPLSNTLRFSLTFGVDGLKNIFN